MPLKKPSGPSFIVPLVRRFGASALPPGTSLPPPKNQMPNGAFRPSLPGPITPPRRGPGDSGLSLPDSAQAGGTPIHLTALTTALPNTAANFPTEALRNPTKGPILIDEIKWTLAAASIAGVDLSFGQGHLLSTIGCDLTLQGMKITSTPIPVWCFGPRENYLSEQRFGAMGGTNTNIGECHWVLKHPIVVPPGEVLVPSLYHFGLFGMNISVRISYSGRAFPSGFKPDKVSYPWVAGYIGKNFNLDGTAQTDESALTDLTNPFDQDINIEYITGRMPSTRRAGTYSVYDARRPSDYMVVEMTRSDGYEVARSLFWTQLFPASSRSIVVPHRMPAHSYYTVSLSLTTALTLANTSARPQIAIIGWRDA